MKIVVITDQHFGVRKNSKLFHDFFLKFYDDIFFPYLVRNNIDTVIDMGDTFDNRTGINYSSLGWAKDNYFDRIRDLKINLYSLVGNHTAYYKNTNDLNAVDLLLREYDNVHVISEYKELEFDGLNIAMIPWINSENAENTYKCIANSKCPVVMGHLELSGFYANKNYKMEHGADKKAYEKFEKVYSGHFHHRNSIGNVEYLGNPYEIYWNDYGDERGFHLFETDTLEMTPINNPYTMFEVLNYNDTPWQTLNASEYENKIVKLVVEQKSKPKQFEKYVDKLIDAGVSDLQIIENFVLTDTDDFEVEQSEDTLTILGRYLDEVEVDIDKDAAKRIISHIYKEACEVV